MQNFRVLDIMDSTLISQESGSPKASFNPAVWPSEASAIRLDNTGWPIVGACHRKSYYRMIGQPVANSVDAVGAWRWVIGRQVEDHATNLTKIARPQIWVANGVKLYVRELALPLEVDIVVRDPETNKAWILECKTFYGAMAKRDLIGVAGKPKLEHIMQICMYLLEIKNGSRLKELVKKSLAERAAAESEGRVIRNRCEADLSILDSLDEGSVGAKIIYLSRDEGDRVEFDITVERDADGFHYPHVNGVPYYTFTIESIFERYATLQNYWFAARQEAVRILNGKGIKTPAKMSLILCRQDLQVEPVPVELTEDEKVEHKAYLGALEAQVLSLPDKFLPPAEFEFNYSDARIEELYKLGKIGKTKYNDWKSTKTGKPTLNKDGSKAKRKAKKVTRLGDWQCLHPDTKVIMEDGALVPIQYLATGATTRCGKVLNVKSKLVDRKMVQVKPFNLPWLYLTEDHKCKVGNSWIEAGKLEKDNYLEVPFDTTEKTTNLLLNDLFVIGLWTAEGWYHHKRPDGGYYKVGFTIHPNENQAADSIKLFARNFTNKNGQPAQVTDRIITDKRNGNKYRYLQINCKHAADFIANWTVGNSAKSKAISKVLMQATSIEQCSLLAGLLIGDGCVTKMRTTDMHVYSTVSDQLAFDVQQILWRQGKVAGITKQINKTGYAPGSLCNHVRWYETKSHVSHISEGVFYTKVHKILSYEYSGEVWDAEIEGSHMIPTSSGIVHNCGYCPYNRVCIPKQDPKSAYMVYDIASINEGDEVEFDED